MITRPTQPIISAVQWGNTRDLLPIPTFHRHPPIHTTLNTRWNILWDRRQWYKVFQDLWQDGVEPKKACLAWLIAHKALWTKCKAARYNIDSEACTRCGLPEDEAHIFIQCPQAAESYKTLHNCNTAMGERHQLETPLYWGKTLAAQTVYGVLSGQSFLWHAWLLRLADTFNNQDLVGTPFGSSLIVACKRYWKKQTKQVLHAESHNQSQTSKERILDFTAAKLENIRNKVTKATFKRQISD